MKHSATPTAIPPVRVNGGLTSNTTASPEETWNHLKAFFSVFKELYPGGVLQTRLQGLEIHNANELLFIQALSTQVKDHDPVEADTVEQTVAEALAKIKESISEAMEVCKSQGLFQVDVLPEPDGREYELPVGYERCKKSIEEYLPKTPGQRTFHSKWESLKTEMVDDGVRSDQEEVEDGVGHDGGFDSEEDSEEDVRAASVDDNDDEDVNDDEDLPLAGVDDSDEEDDDYEDNEDMEDAQDENQDQDAIMEDETAGDGIMEVGGTEWGRLEMQQHAARRFGRQVPRS